MKISVALVFTTLTIMSVGVARADAADDQFIKQLATQGITGDNDALIAAGHAACDNYGNVGINGVMFQITGQGFSMPQASSVVMAAWHVLCPQKTGA